jgi:hypothetical protein
LFCSVSSFLYNCLFPIFVKGYRLLAMRGNPIAGNIIYKGKVIPLQAWCGPEGG